MELTILFPCLNEEKTIAACVQAAKEWLKHNNIQGEVLVVDNGSTDLSADIAEFVGARVVRENKRGYGYAIQRGIHEARGDVIVMLDADCSYSLEDVGAFLVNLEEYQFVCGNRFKGRIELGAMPKSHFIGTKILSYIGRCKTGVQLGDFNCGLRAFKKSIYDNVDFVTTGMDFASEMIAVAGKLTNNNVTEVAVNLYKDKRDTPSHLNTIRDGCKHLKYLLAL